MDNFRDEATPLSGAKRAARRSANGVGTTWTGFTISTRWPKSRANVRAAPGFEPAALDRCFRVSKSLRGVSRGHSAWPASRASPGSVAADNQSYVRCCRVDTTITRNKKAKSNFSAIDQNDVVPRDHDKPRK
jgi:hypothetical protein